MSTKAVCAGSDSSPSGVAMSTVPRPKARTVERKRARIEPSAMRFSTSGLSQYLTPALTWSRRCTRVTRAPLRQRADAGPDRALGNAVLDVRLEPIFDARLDLVAPMHQGDPGAVAPQVDGGLGA